MEERSDGILLRPVASAVAKLSWDETALEMARAGEDWSAWDTTLADGLDALPWEPVALKRVAEPTPHHGQRSRPKRK